ncbi:MAG: hypothetical protein LPD71_00125 [Shewanella sp.]|nr:hypothetical protein [Shewanella sp.]MCF1437208.1 hypothetical protein [Shewanella sp.]MCF1459478.1 hypothetical protein [Shewanella sp.]
MGIDYCMNFLELAVSLRQECSVSGSGPISINDNRAEYQRIIKWIREANIELQGKYANWKFLWTEASLTTEADKNNYLPGVELPANIRLYRPLRFFCDDMKVREVDWLTIRHFGVRENDYGQPTHLTIMPNNGLKLYPKPDKPYSLYYEYYKKPQILEEAYDVPWIPETWHKLIVYRAMMMYADYENAPEIKTEGMEGLASIMPQLEADQLPGQKDMSLANEYDIVVEPC